MGILRQSDWLAGSANSQVRTGETHRSNLATAEIGRNNTQMDIETKLEQLEQDKFKNKEYQNTRQSRAREAQAQATTQKSEYEAVAADNAEAAEKLFRIAQRGLQAEDTDDPNFWDGTIELLGEVDPIYANQLKSAAPDERRKVAERILEANSQNITRYAAAQQQVMKGQQAQALAAQQGGIASDQSAQDADEAAALQNSAANDAVTLENHKAANELERLRTTIASAESIAEQKRWNDLDIASLGAGDLGVLNKIYEVDRSMAFEYAQKLLDARISKDRNKNALTAKQAADLEADKIKQQDDWAREGMKAGMTGFMMRLSGEHGLPSIADAKEWTDVDGYIEMRTAVVTALKKGDIKGANGVQTWVNANYLVIDKDQGFIRMPWRNGERYGPLSANDIHYTAQQSGRDVEEVMEEYKKFLYDKDVENRNPDPYVWNF